MHDALACGQPLHITRAKAGRGAQRIRVVNKALAHDGHGLKATVRMRRKARYGLAVVHAPTVFATKVLTQVAPLQGSLRPHSRVTRRVGVVVVHAKQKRVYGLPWETQRLVAQDGAVRHVRLQKEPSLTACAVFWAAKQRSR